MKLIRKIVNKNEKIYTNYFIVFDNGDKIEIEPHWKDTRSYLLLRAHSEKLENE